MNSSNLVIYEQPLNERMRTFLRLEQLFNQTLYFLNGDSEWDTRQAMSGLVDIINTIERIDIKGETIKELERFEVTLNKLKQIQGINTEKLDEILQKNHQIVAKLHAVEGKIGHKLKANGLFSAIRQRMVLAGGPSSFDTPQYHNWLQQSVTLRHRTLSTWLSEFEPVFSAIILILALTRESSDIQDVEAISGSFEKALQSNQPCQLLRIFIDNELGAYPEVSAGKHHIHIHFKHLDENGNTNAYNENLPFRLVCCQM